MTPNYASRQVFNSEQEKEISEYVLMCSKMCYGKSTRDLRELAYEVAVINDVKVPDSWHENKAAGVDWMRAFLKRNQQLSIRQPESCSLARCMSFNKFNVDLFFDNLDSILNRSQSFADGSRIWNLDETATTTVVNKSKKVIAGKGSKGVNVVAGGEKGVLVTTCCFVNAMGNSMPPAMIFPRVNFREHMLNGAPPGTLGLASPTGWMVADLFPNVLEHFIKYSNPSEDNPVLLIFDNHASHLSIQALNKAKESGIVILTLPPHSSNKMQPLDVSCYAPFKAYYASAVDAWNKQHPGRVFSIYEVASCVGIAHTKAMTPTTIKNGFQKCGIFPFDRNVFTEADYIMSAPTYRPNPDVCQENEPVASTSSTSNKESHPHNPNVCQDDNPVASNSSTPNTASSNVLDIAGNPHSPKFIGPAEYFGYPKASFQQERRKTSRERGRSFIPTDTPEKLLIEEGINKKQKKTKTERKLFPKGVDEENESETDLSDVWSDTSSDGGIECGETEPEFNFGLLDHTPHKGEFVLVEFDAKKKCYYIGKVLKERDGEGDIEVMFLRRSVKQTNLFYFPDVEDVSSVRECDIRAILPTPTTHKGTKRTMSLLRFEVDFFNVEVR